MSAEIAPFRPGTVGDGFRVEPNDVLSGGMDKLSTVVVLGLTDEGKLYLAASDGAERAYFLMERAKLWLLDEQGDRP